MDIGRLESRIKKIVLENLNRQDLFQTNVRMFNQPMALDEIKKINDVGILRYRNDALFNQRVCDITARIIDEISKTMDEEGIT